MLSAICFNLDQSNILSSSNGLIEIMEVIFDWAENNAGTGDSFFLFPQSFQKLFLSMSLKAVIKW